jgi:broad specificity phosphatase PhoE
MLTLVLVRHGEAQYRAANGSYVPDGALTRRGAEQAKALARPLRELRIDLALTSPCRRTRQTSALAGLEATVHDDLAEWRYGPYTRALSAGMPEADDPWWIWQQATVLRRNEPETLGQLVERVDRVLGHIATAVGNDAVAVVVSHGHLLRVLTARWLGLPVLAAAQLQLLPASISRLTESAGHWSLTTWNSTPSVTTAA